MSEEKKSTAVEVWMRERQSEGWFNRQTGELTRGVRIGPDDTVIDVGCGEGGFIGFCAGQGARVIFIDRDAARLARTEARIGITTLLEATNWFELAGAEWVPSLMVRRHLRLELRYR